MDEGDKAKEWAERQIEDALEAHRRRRPGPGLTHCEECGEEIPAARRDKVPGCRRCIECQRELERRQGRK